MWHQAKHVARTIADAGNTITRAVWICGFADVSFQVAVSEDDPVISLKLFHRCIIADVVSFGMSDRNP